MIKRPFQQKGPVMRKRWFGQFACHSLSIVVGCIVVGCIVVGPDVVSAQQGGGTTTVRFPGGYRTQVGGQTGSGTSTSQGGTFGSTGSLGTGSQGTGSLGTGSQGTGSLGTGGSGTGSLGTGTTGTGQTTGGQGSGGSGGGSPGSTADFQLQSDTGLSQLQQNAAANQAEVGFVGGPDADAQNATFSNANPDGAGAVGAFSVIDGFFRQLNALNANAGNVRTSRRVIRAPLRVGFAVSRPSDAVLSTRFMERFQKNPILREIGEVEATLENQTMTLTGFVRSADQRVIVEQQALLEPGVSRVDNQLTVLAADE